MNRYCPNCQKEFDFTIRSLEDLDSLVCPECGGAIARDSRRPLDTDATERTELSLGLVLLLLARIGYVFYALLSLLGIAAYFLGWTTGLYIMTGTCLAVFLIQQLIGVGSFRTGLLFLPLGAAAGAFLLKSPAGACLGVAAVFLIRHVLWELLFWLVGKLLKLSSRP